jgi:hypothetical protein
VNGVADLVNLVASPFQLTQVDCTVQAGGRCQALRELHILPRRYPLSRCAAAKTAGSVAQQGLLEQDETQVERK